VNFNDPDILLAADLTKVVTPPLELALSPETMEEFKNMKRL
jgi:hypothetical protein